MNWRERNEDVELFTPHYHCGAHAASRAKEQLAVSMSSDPVGAAVRSAPHPRIMEECLRIEAYR